ncbi:hypothetical protein Pcinc_020241 [Petrolisthes cinctipes]|uniref:Uncharacterized protein n=1 Tax=Petrolisthes cinctipes TaxID=88211 RepID=A0AAE1FIJ0_PETCI|nr:hypothetical protein Pcinc_020241 [Petrolisthes cinctipes]
MYQASMKRIAILIMWCILHTTQAFNYDCPQHCNCDGPTAKCEGGIIPSLNPRITAFEIEDMDTPITTLTSDITQQLKNLVSLRLNSIGLTRVEAGALAVIDRLLDLYINNNNINMLTKDTFLNCSSLTHLNLDHNNIHIIQNDTFMPLEQLQILSLAHNALKVLPNYMPRSIQNLNIEDNNLSTITQLFLDHLESLNLCHNSIIHIDADQISLNELRSLCLGGPNFTLSDSIVSPSKFPQLKQLTLMGSQQSPLLINPDVQSNIKTMARTSLHKLHLQSCNLLSADLFNLTNSKLTDVKATDTTFTTRRVMKRSVINLPYIAILDFSGSPLLAQTFLHSPRPSSAMPHLRILKMSRCGVTAFYESFLLQQVPNITHLDLSYNPLECTCYGMTWIPDYVREGKLNLLQELNTTCSKPSHLSAIPVLTATMCPITRAIHTTTTTTSITNELPQTTPHLCVTSSGSSNEASKCKNPSTTTIGLDGTHEESSTDNGQQLSGIMTGVVISYVLVLILN